MLRTVRVTCISTLTLLTLPSALLSQAWKDQINNHILDSRNVQAWLADGYSRSQTPVYDLLAAGSSQRITLNLEAGRTYKIIAQCDNDCTDVDLRLFDPGDNLVDSDVKDDDYPVVSVAPSRSGAYGLRVTMVKCTTRTCGFGVAVFAKGSASGGGGGSSGNTTGWREQINNQLEQSMLVSSAREIGFSRSHETQYDLLAAGASQRVTLQLIAGKAYQFIGKCDYDCSDLDLRLYDANDNLLDSDVDTDDVPILSVIAPRSGSYRLQVNMVKCATRTCGWGVMIMGK